MWQDFLLLESVVRAMRSGDSPFDRAGRAQPRSTASNRRDKAARKSLHRKPGRSRRCTPIARPASGAASPNRHSNTRPRISWRTTWAPARRPGPRRAKSRGHGSPPVGRRCGGCQRSLAFRRGSSCFRADQPRWIDAARRADDDRCGEAGQVVHLRHGLDVRVILRRGAGSRWQPPQVRVAPVAPRHRCRPSPNDRRDRRKDETGR